jgi:hypothetical protein
MGKRLNLVQATMLKREENQGCENELDCLGKKFCLTAHFLYYGAHIIS